MGQSAERIDDAQGLAWDYTSDARVVAFYLYVSTQSGVYDWQRPVASVPALPEMVTRLAREDLILPGPGTYYAVVRALSLSGAEDSGPSNEVSFVYGDLITPPPPLPPMTPKPPVLPKPILPPVIHPPSAPTPIPPNAQSFVDQCMWRGGDECRPGARMADTPPRPAPPSGPIDPGGFTAQCMWRGGEACRP